MSMGNLTDNGTIDDVSLQFSSSTKVLLILVFTITAFIALISNVIAIVVNYYGHRTGKTVKMLLSNLALCDILALMLHFTLSYTQTLYNQWLLASWFCPISMFTYLVWDVVNVITISLISSERFITKFCLTLLLRKHRHALISEDEHFHENSFMMLILAYWNSDKCFLPKFSLSSYTIIII